MIFYGANMCISKLTSVIPFHILHLHSTRSQMKLLLILLILPSLTLAQDTICTPSRKIPAIISEVSPNFVKYRKVDNPNGPIFILPAADITKIIYANGSVDSFPPNKTQKTIKSSTDTDVKHHFIGANIMDFIMTDFTFCYEYTFPKGIFSLRMPVTIGFNNTQRFPVDPSILFLYSTIFRSGVDFRISPKPNNKVRYVFGPSVQGSYGNRFNDINLNPESSLFVSASYARFLFYNGFVAEPVPHFRFALDAGLGLITNFSPPPTSLDALNRPAFQLNIFLGYRF